MEQDLEAVGGEPLTESGLEDEQGEPEFEEERRREGEER